MQLIPIQSIKNQTLQVQLDNQPCTLDIYQLAYGLFMNVYLNNTLIVAGVICENLNRIVRSVYLGLSGDFVFVDTQGSSDPIYNELGSRFQLIYLSASEIPDRLI